MSTSLGQPDYHRNASADFLSNIGAFLLVSTSNELLDNQGKGRICSKGYLQMGRRGVRERERANAASSG